LSASLVYLSPVIFFCIILWRKNWIPTCADRWYWHSWHNVLL